MSPQIDNASLTSEERQALREVLCWDLTSEYDARFLTEYLHSLELRFSDEFVAQQRLWARDEERHFDGFAAVYEQLFGSTENLLSERRPDFAPLAHLFGGEFEICCLLAYDELATVRGYHVNLDLYDRLGPEFGAFVRGVIADEGRHWGTFMELLRSLHRDRLHEAPAVVARLRAAEGTPYRATFVLDHDEALYTDEIFDDAARVLLRTLASASQREESSCQEA